MLRLEAIGGGVGREYLDWRTPSVPDYCTIKIAGRIAPGQTPQSALEDICGMLERVAAHDPTVKAEARLVESTQRIYMPPFEIAVDHPFVREAEAIYQTLTNRTARVGDVAPYKFYGTDAAHLASKAAMTGFVCGPGGKYNTMPDERVEVNDVIAAAKFYALMALQTCA